MKTRNIIDYTEKYRELPFEAIQLAYRRKRVLAEITKFRPQNLLEVGCGQQPLFRSIPLDICKRHTVIEPSPEFAMNATALAEGQEHIHVVNEFIENFDVKEEQFDMVVASCVLHEVPNPQVFLSAIHRLCKPNTIVHINVPNARSLHRLLAVSMGLISHAAAQSDTQVMMQQRAMTYDQLSLREELERAGFSISEFGSLFVKPFTHAQMQQLVDEGFMTQRMLDGFDKLVEFLPELGSEIWVNAKLGANT